MEIEEAIRIVRALADKVNPYTGEALSKDSIHHNPQTVKALNRALGSLVSQHEREKNRPANAGKYWPQVEDEQVCEELRNGIDFQQIAKAHNRTIGSIVARLVKLGKIAPKTLPPKAA